MTNPILAELQQTLNANVALCAELQNTLGYVLSASASQLFLMEDGNQYRLAGIGAAKTFQSTSLANRICDMWNSQSNVVDNEGLRLEVLSMEAAAIRHGEHSRDLLRTLSDAVAAQSA